MNKVKLDSKITNALINLPENGMGYHIVDVILKNNDLKLKDRIILNCTYLLLEENENYECFDIERIETNK